VPPAGVLAALEEVLAPVRAAAPPRLMWSRRSQWHLTVQFLGVVDDIDALVRAVGAAAQETGVFSAGLGRVGAFPSVDRASVVWVGLDEGIDGIAGLAERVGVASAPLGYVADPRPYTAHLTVARARRPCPVGSLVASIGDGPFGRTWDVRELVLFESETRPTGAVHREVAVLALGGGWT
jgi:2'-5' RNA ligase